MSRTDSAGRIAYFRITTEGPQLLLACQREGISVSRVPSKRTLRLWKLPGGRPSKKESREECALRKFQEKTGFELPRDHRRFHYFVDLRGERVFLAVDKRAGAPTEHPPFSSGRIERVTWFPLRGLPIGGSEAGAEGAPLSWANLAELQTLFSKYQDMFVALGFPDDQIKVLLAQRFTRT